MKLCTWVSQDSKDCDLDQEGWNVLFLASALVSGGLYFSISKPALSWFVLISGFVLPSAVYVLRRNAKVEDSQKVLTPNHLQQLASHYFKIDFSKAESRAESEIPV
ncbi:MAG: hypothetical protein ACK47R_04700, partial [Planctomycetia bacterium]